MKVIGTVVDKKCNLIGLSMEGRASEFSEIGNEKVVRVNHLNEVLSRRFKNNQIDCSQGLVKEVGNFKLKELPMHMFDNGYTPIDNKITLLERVLVDNKLKGFTVNIAGQVKRYTTEDIIKLSWFNRENFSVRVNGDTVFIVGKPGFSIEKLPEVELGNDTGSKSKRNTTRSATNKEVANQPIGPANFDILTLYENLNQLNGLVIKLPNIEYIKNNPQPKKIGEDFNNLGIGEVANAYLDYTEDKLNVNTRFKKIGNITVNIQGMPLPVPTFIVTTKNIFLNAENHMEVFGVAVSEKDVPALKEAFAASLALEEIHDDLIINPIRSIYGDKTLKAFKVDTSKIAVIAPNKLQNFILGNKEIFNLTQTLLKCKVHQKYLNAVVKQATEALARQGIETNRPKYGIYSAMSDDVLNQLVEKGVDVYTGIYTKKEDTDEVQEYEAKKVKAARDGEYVEERVDLEAAYKIKGFITIPSAKDLQNRAPKAEKFIDPELDKIMKVLNSMDKVEELLKKAEEFQTANDKLKKRVIKQLWLHKVSSFLITDKKGYKASNWEIVSSTSKSQEVREYACTDEGCEGLLLKLTGMDLIS